MEEPSVQRGTLKKFIPCSEMLRNLSEREMYLKASAMGWNKGQVSQRNAERFLAKVHSWWMWMMGCPWKNRILWAASHGESTVGWQSPFRSVENMGESTGERAWKQLFFEGGTRWGPRHERVPCTRGLWDAHHGSTYHRKCHVRVHSWAVGCEESPRGSLEIASQVSTQRSWGRENRS